MSGSSNLLVDTNILLYLLKGDTTVSQILDGKNVMISFVTELELLGYSDLESNDKVIVQDLLNELIIIDINSRIKTEVIRIRSKYRLKLPDAIIAATAIYQNTPLISADSDFNKVEELNFILYEV